MQIIEIIKDLCRRPSVKMLALKELEEAQRNLLEAQTGLDYAKNICNYNVERIKRLNKFLEENLENHQSGDKQ
jgi:hypothetical protein